MIFNTDCIVSFSSKGREDYNKGLCRLIDSAIEKIHNLNMLLYSTDHPLVCHRGFNIHKGLPQPKSFISLSHSDMPYQFKIALIQQAVDMGYKRVVWLDSSMIIAKDLEPLFGPTGVTVFHNVGHELINYISDRAMMLLMVSEEKVRTMKQIWGGALMFDFTKPNAVKVFEEIKTFSLSGAFANGSAMREGFVGHRHDQAVISVLVHGRCDMMPYGRIVCPPHDTNGEYGDDIYLICKGIE